MNEQDTIYLKSIASSLEELVELKQSEVALKRIEIMLHENFQQSLFSAEDSHKRATRAFYEDFKDGI